MKEEFIDFYIEEMPVKGKLILFKEGHDKEGNWKELAVYRLEPFEYSIPFEGTPMKDITDEFPDAKFPLQNLLDVYVMFVNGELILEGI